MPGRRDPIRARIALGGIRRLRQIEAEAGGLEAEIRSLVEASGSARLLAVCGLGPIIAAKGGHSATAGTRLRRLPLHQLGTEGAQLLGDARPGGRAPPPSWRRTGWSRRRGWGTAQLLAHRRPEADERLIETPGGRSGVCEISAGSRLGAAAVEDAVQAAVGNAPHPLGRVTGRTGGRDHVDLGAFPYHERLAAAERLPHRFDEVSEAGVLRHRLFVTSPVAAVDARNASDGTVLGSFEHHELRRHLQHAV